MFKIDTDYALRFVLDSGSLHKSVEYFANEASIRISLEPAAELIELMEQNGWSRRGRLSWSTSARNNSRGFRQVLTNHIDIKAPLRRQFEDYGNRNYCYGGNGCNRRLGNNHGMADHRNDTWFDAFNDNNHDSINLDLEDRRIESLMSIKISQGAGDTVWLRISPVDEGINYAVKEENVIDMPRSRYHRMKPVEALTIVDRIDTEFGWDNVGDERSEAVIEAIQELDSMVTVGYSPNNPSKVVMRRGFNTPTKGIRFAALRKFSAGENHEISLDKALELRDKYNGHVKFVIHPALEDIVSMKTAKPYEGDPRLRDYQRIAVGLHLATKIGYLQSCSTGIGKTVMQLVAMRERSRSIKNYRAFVVCDANVREQWVEEAGKWFPEAYTHIIDKPTTEEEANNVVNALAQRGPVIIFASYSNTTHVYNELEEKREREQEMVGMTYRQKMRYLSNIDEDITVGNLLFNSRWDDICADEAVVIRNNASKQAKALWHLRQNSDIATALTATPINKSPDDIARLLSWVRNDAYMFSGTPLAEEYDTTSSAGAKALYDSLSPLVFRRDSSEAEADMPETNPDVLLLKPSPQEEALTNAATNELQRCYNELVASLEELEAAQTSDTEKEEVAKAKEQLKEARGAWLGGKTLARMAVSEPSALKSSTSVGAVLLDGQGLIDAAMADVPTKRKALIKQLTERVENGEQVIVFTSFAKVATILTKAIREAGINAKSFTGTNSTTRDRARREFQNGEIDVLVCSKAAERGLTLHKATALYHYDLPWTLSEIIQRTGRAVRFGSENEVVDIVFMVMEGTVEQFMADRLIKLAVSSSLILDGSRGVNIKNTDIGNSMGGLITALGSRNNKAELELGEQLFGKTPAKV